MKDPYTLGIKPMLLRPYTVAIVGAAAVTCIALAQYHGMVEERRPKSAREVAEERAERILGLIDRWMQDQREGGTGAYHWAKGHTPSNFYSVYKWEVVKPPSGYGEEFDTVNLLVESSTKGGQPVRNTWRISVQIDENSIPRIAGVTDLSN